MCMIWWLLYSTYFNDINLFLKILFPNFPLHLTFLYMLRFIFEILSQGIV